MENTARQQMPDTRRRILERLKLEGPKTAQELSEALGLSAMGVRQHLTALERDGFVDHESQQRGQGRPNHVYALTSVGDDLFPRTYSDLTKGLLDAVRDLDGDGGVERIFEARTRQLERQYRSRMEGKSFGDRVAELAQLRTEAGYMADWIKEDAETYLLREHNCSICEIAKQCAQACTYELKLFQRVFDDAQITRQEHMIQGDRMCTYVIRRQGTDGP